MRWIHILTGLGALAAGALALGARKGGRLHARSGWVFVATMLVMSGSGALMAVFAPSRLSLLAGVLTFYLVATALLTVRRPPRTLGRGDVTGLLVALAVGLAGLAFGFAALRSPTGRIDGLPAAPGFMFGVVGLLAAVGDARLLLGRGVHGTARLTRHLWRMSFALFIATASFFLGQARLFPRPLRASGVLAVPVLLVLAALAYWLVRVRSKGMAARVARAAVAR
jgi:uncharacterized membrane protein